MQLENLDFYFWLMLIVLILNFFLAFFVFLKNRRNKVSQSYFAFILSMCLWIIALIAYYYIPYRILFTGRLTFVLGSVFLPFLSLFFVYLFPKKIFKVPLWLITLLLIESSITAIIGLFTGAVYLQEFIINGSRETIYGNLYYLLESRTILYVLAMAVVLVYKYIKLKGIHKLQIKYILFGILISAFSLIVILIIIPPTTGYFEIQKSAPLFTLILFSFTAYAIVKYRLMDIRFIISRSLIYLILVTLVTVGFVTIPLLAGQFFGQGIGISKIMVSAIGALVIVLLIDPLKKGLAKVTDKIFFKSKIDYQEVLKNISDVINKEIVLDRLITSLEKTIKEQLKIKEINVLLLGNKNCFFEKDGTCAKDVDTLINTLRKEKKLLVLEELDRKISDLADNRESKRLDKVRRSMEARDVYLAVPILMENKKLNAILLLDRKMSGDSYGNEDIGLFEVLAPQFASALEKAKLYQESLQFTERLKNEVARATTKLRQVNQELKILDQAKSDFMNIASHQLRTPLSGIIGYLSMVLEGDYGEVNKNQKSTIEGVFNASRRLSRLVDTFLNVSRIEAGKFYLNLQQANIEDIIDVEVREMVFNAKDKKLNLIFNKPVKPLPKVNVDVDKLKDVIINLIDNAIKYTSKGSVVVTANSVNGNILVQVKDTGVGIPKEEAAKLFSKFVRGRGIAKIQPDGSGLGLYIAKKIVEAHNGKIWVESEGLGKGSTFQFTIPLKSNIKKSFLNR